MPATCLINHIDWVSEEPVKMVVDKTWLIYEARTPPKIRHDSKLQAHNMIGGVWKYGLGRGKKGFVVLDFPLTTGFCGFVEFDRHVLAILNEAVYSKCQWRDHRLHTLLAISDYHVSFADVHPTKRGS